MARAVRVAVLLLLTSAAGLRLSSGPQQGEQQEWPPPKRELGIYSGPEGCQKVAYIRIQKTGSSTLAEFIMPMLTERYNQTQITFHHVEYNEAMELSPNCTVITLRDPVERLMSEFNMFRSFVTTGEFPFEQDQWDIHSKDFPWLNRVKAIKDTKEQFTQYLKSPVNPSKNRQTRYLLGFNRVKCEESRCCGICRYAKPLGYPAFAYRWRVDHKALLEQAKQHLASLRGFAITDCYAQSIQPLAKAIGWDPEEVGLYTDTVHWRQQRSQTNLMKMAIGFGTEQVAFSRAAGNKSRDVPWSEMLPLEAVQEIRRLNFLDVELLDFAKKLLYERHGIDCRLPAAQKK